MKLNMSRIQDTSQQGRPRETYRIKARMISNMFRIQDTSQQDRPSLKRIVELLVDLALISKKQWPIETLWK